jgi:hypothetical protein
MLHLCGVLYELDKVLLLLLACGRMDLSFFKPFGKFLKLINAKTNVIKPTAAEL